MDNRDRDKMSNQSKGSTSPSNVKGSTSEQRGKLNSDSSSSFGKNIGRSEGLNEPSKGQSQQGGWQSSQGRKGVSDSGSSSYGSSKNVKRDSDSDRDSSDISGDSSDRSGSRH